ncbi:uncharacterized protein SAMN05444156_0411 [Verrucomicrobium sp. GAS474]|uniref:ATP-dependent sacrificial sulfur transferase LarE n=1 Tax=Verrucomicrobium sp. GAS474 TaxID=1882831 RepID=UPI00087DC5BA|nr:ATP-dependent sacrificial sulfur transferase LarE [Verrucomicrobium sp. GAS474]SDT88434.1 uncharacterized protein SAMN05444156_0411 [Verrucomicrobium sp. GAS474]
METAHDKQARLDALLGGWRGEGLLVAYSGGVDSAFLAWRAHAVLGDRMKAVIADSPSLARRHLREAVRFAAAHGIPLEIVRTAELDNPDYAKNDAARCFHCKSELFTVMAREQARLGGLHLAYGMNLDDRGDYRPGQKAAEQHGVLAPLVEAGLTKAEIRALSREAGLDVWDKPASPCLSSRIAYGEAVDAVTLAKIEAGEEVLWELGFRQFRVRQHGEIARIEIAREEMEKALSLAVFDRIALQFKEIGFRYAALDCMGYSSGNLNQALTHAPIP